MTRRYIRLPIAATPTHCLGDCPRLDQKSIPTWCRVFGMLERDDTGFRRAAGCVEAEAADFVTLLEVQHVLFAADYFDPEHQITCHADTLPAAYREACQTLEKVQAIVGSALPEIG